MLPFCEDADNRVRANAVKALWNLGRREVVEVVNRMLNSDVENMRLSGVWVLAEIRCPGATEDLMARLKIEPSERVRTKILESLALLKKPPQPES